VSVTRYLELFRSESREHIAAINESLLALERDPSARDAVESIFRAVHTIKGMAATVGSEASAAVAHEFEAVLDRIRAGRAPVGARVLDVMFRAVDALESTLDDEPDQVSSPPVVAELRALGVVSRVFTGAGPSHGNGGHPPPDRSASAPPPAAAEAAVSAAAGAVEVRIRTEADAALPGVRAFLALRTARELGEVQHTVPEEAALHGDEFGGELRVWLITGCEAEEIRRRMLAVGEIASVEVVTPVAERASREEQEAPSAAAPEPEPEERARRSLAASRHVRVEASRLDTLMDRVGELVIIRDRLVRASGRGDREVLDDAIDQVARLIGQLRDEVLELRMVAVRDVFSRFARLIRDSARSLGREVDLVIEGDDTEMDRSVLERIGDPLVHLLRNAVDHGIEPPDERARAGKPRRGRIHLRANREGSGLVIRLTDDGRGIDRARVRRKAAELGLVDDAASVAEDEVLHLITRPGFSTADRVSDVSGRGVGLDVVATQVRSLGGTLDVASQEGEGSTFTLRLPLTVGLMRVLLVSVEGTSYAIPVAHVAETVEVGAAQVREIGGREVAFVRGEPVPLISLRDVLRASRPADPVEPVSVVILETEDEWLGLSVDGLFGQQEVVTKPFDATRCTLPVFAGATILTDGTPALMLDAAALMRHRRAPAQPSRT
jgi:two-component system, chemotaxis family, sensor kinase CheA